MASVKVRWKFPFHHRSSSTPSSPSAAATSRTASPAEDEASDSSSEASSTAIPAEFLCPISKSLMADPVIVPSGHTFERACIQACKDLSFSPSPPLVGGAAVSLDFFIPNSALRLAILGWCDRSSLPHPQPVSRSRARSLVRRLILSSSTTSDNDKNDNNSTSNSSSSGEPPRTPPPSNSLFYSYSSSSSSSEIETLTPKSKPPKSPPPPVNENDDSNFPSPPADPLEDEVCLKLKSNQVSEQESALVSLRQATRESSRRRISLCSPRLLAAVRPMLLSRYPALQTNAAAALVNLSLEPANKVKIVRAMAVPPLVDALKFGHLEARDHAAAALFSLALEDENRAAIGVLGAIPPLLQLFARDAVARPARWEAGMALYNLSLGANNRSILARTPGAAKALLGVAAEEELGKVALMVMCNMAACGEGRASMMDSGAVAAVLDLLREGGLGQSEAGYCVGVLYGMSRGRRSLRFMGLARAAGAEEVLVGMEEKGEDNRREMVRRTLMAVRGEEAEDLAAAAVLGEEEGSVVSDGLVSFRRRVKDFGHGSGPNSAEF